MRETGDSEVALFLGLFSVSMSSIKRDAKKKVLPRPEARCFLEIQPTGIRLR
jgi:hypothetical protein